MRCRCLLSVALLASCTKPTDEVPAKITPAPVEAAAITEAPLRAIPGGDAAPASSSGAAIAAKPHGTSEPLASATPSAAPSATPSAAPSAAPIASASRPAKPVSTRTSSTHFVLDVAAPGDCRSGADCTATLRLEALAEYHVNKEYPYKFLANAAPDVQFLGKDSGGNTVFSKAAGDFHADSETVGTLTVRFKPTTSGTVTIAGTYKMSVCSEANCQMEQPKVSLAVPVM